MMNIDLFKAASDLDAKGTQEDSCLRPNLQSGNTDAITTKGKFLVVDTSRYQYLRAGNSEVISYVYSIGVLDRRWLR